MIRITRTNDEIVAISFNGEELHTDGGDRWYLPKKIVGDEIVDHLPEHIVFEVSGRIENRNIGEVTIPVYIQKISEAIVWVSYEDTGNQERWENPNEFRSYMEAKKAVIVERAAEEGDILLDAYEDNGTSIRLLFSTKIEANKVSLAISLAEQMIAEIEKAVDTRLA